MFLIPGQTNISEDIFNQFDWEGFYKGYEEPIPVYVMNPHSNLISIHVFVDFYHTGDKVTRRSQSGILMYCNMASVIWYSKNKDSVQTLKFGSEFTTLKQGF